MAEISTVGLPMTEEKVYILLCTLPPGQPSHALARKLVEERLAACVNLLPQIRSVYRWEDAVSDDEEVLALIKAPQSRLPALRARIHELHPYDVPELVTVAPEHVDDSYAQWVLASCRDVDAV